MRERYLNKRAKIPPLLLPNEKIERLVIFGSKEVIGQKIKELEALGFKEDKGND